MHADNQQKELHAHGFPMFYYDSKKIGEVDFLVDDYDKLTVLPLEIKSGKDYTEHSALGNFLRVSALTRLILFSMIG